METEQIWHTLDSQAALEQLGSGPSGLSAREVENRRERYGRNELPRKKPPSLLAVFLHQFKSPLIYILLVAAAIALILGDLADAGFIFGVVMLNAVIGAYQEHRSEASAASLEELLRERAKVRREGRELVIDSEELVPGDRVLLESGNRVPADLRLITASDLRIDESLLTGESMAVHKKAEALRDPELELAERRNMAFAGSSVHSGRAEGVVVSTGLGTELGSISQAVSHVEATKPPLVLRMERFVKHISVAVLGVVVLLSIALVLRGDPVQEVFFIAIALVVAAIPEGLPVAMTVALSIGVRRMARRHVIVRRLPAVEGLGSCTYIASDKTGTLTLNRQTATMLSLPLGQEQLRVPTDRLAGDRSLPADRIHALISASVIPNEASLAREPDGDWRADGDAVDVAFLRLAHEAGVDPEALRGRIRTVAAIPYESERKYSARAYEEDGKIKVAAKGATEKLLSLCSSIRVGQGAIPMNRSRVEEEETALAKLGLRVIAVAEGEMTGKDTARKFPEFSPEFSEDQLPPLTLLGFVGFRDPLRREALAAVRKCVRAGIRVGMITGDHPGTALAIARDLGIAHSERDVLTGRQLHAIPEHDSKGLQEVLGRVQVFARVSPLQKVRIVEALVNMGHFVAVTGDGVNDAPALRKANIGAAMGSGTDVAKQTASIIVTDDNFASIEAGVEEGRFAYANLRKVIYFLISTGAGSVALFTLALFFGLPMPLTAIQLLWINLVTNGIQDVGLAFEAGEAGVMDRPPRRPDEGIFDRHMIRETALISALIGLVGFGAWWWMMEQGWQEDRARNLLLLLLVFFGNFHAVNCRSETLSVFQVPFRNNRVLMSGIAVALAIHLSSLYAPFLQAVLRTQPVSWGELGIMAALASSVLLASETYKAARRRSERASGDKLAGMPEPGARGADEAGSGDERRTA